MKRIINGYLFDTDKMKLVGSYNMSPITTKELYKGKVKYAIKENSLSGFVSKVSLYEISEIEFKDFLMCNDVDKYIELYGENEFKEA